MAISIICKAGSAKNTACFIWRGFAENLLPHNKQWVPFTRSSALFYFIDYLSFPIFKTINLKT
jgi:hypothetical protein